MSRIKFILFWLGVFCLANLSFGQQATMPTQCTNPGGGILVGGSFTVSPDFGCLNFTNNTTTATAFVSGALSPSGGSLSNLGYIFDLKDGRDITRFPPIQNSITVSNPGTYWILQGGNDGGINYITCKSFEVMKTEQPDIKISSCGAKDITVTFLNTVKNQTHGGYSILWGDGEQDIIDGITASSFPFDRPHTYVSPPTSQPQIVANYTRSGRKICPSTPFSFNAETSNKPKISELEGLTGGTSNKITMIEGSDDKAHILEQKLKTGNWTDTGKKITRKAGETSATETITGFNPTNEYCFRLKTTDDCNNSILSNEVCTIIPKVTVMSSREVKLDWNSPDPAVVRYTIPYSEAPTGANAGNALPVSPTATIYLSNALDCKKKYNFSINAFIGAASNQVIIKSPIILIDPKTSILLPPKTVGTVSVENNNMIRFNVLQLDPTPPSKYKFYRSEGGVGNFLPVTESTNNFYEDRNVEPTKQQYCYKVEYEDDCGNTSEQSPAFCSIYLTSTQTNTLNWTPFVIQSNNPFPIEYYIQSIDGNNNYQTVNLTTNTSQNVRQQIEDLLDLMNTNGEAKFVIRAAQKISININGTPTIISLDVSSNEYLFTMPAQLFIPTAFSPNEDGMNDIFAAKGRYIDEFNLEIYDRWGNVVFESKNLNTGWNGTTSDGTTPAPPGNYGFKVYGFNPAGQKFEKVGSVTLIR